MSSSAHAHGWAQARRWGMRLLGAVLVALLTPVVALAVLVALVGLSPPDPAATATSWFSAVALGAAVAGWLTASRHAVVGVSLTAVVAALATLWAWWSSTDESGLFVIGFSIALPPVLVGGPALVVAGRGLRTARRRGGAAPGR